MKKDKEEINEEEAIKITNSFFAIAREGFFKRNYKILIFLVVFFIGIVTISSALVDLMINQYLAPLNFLFIFSCFLYVFISVLFRELVDKEVDRYCEILTSIYLEDTKRILDNTITKIKEFNDKIDEDK